MNYNESNVTGSEYTRCNGIRITNPIGMTPSVVFSEERATLLTGRTMTEQAGEISLAFDPSKVITLVNPETLEPTGQTTTYGAVYGILFSAYLNAAQERDAQ